ncbi:MAG: hypothetical protein M3P82_06605 [Bacteroidota bacterium]|nr:hypothetical protein [Bacteroidota bacterium]
MIKSHIRKDLFLFLLFSIITFFIYTLFLIYSGYFEIGLLSDDYSNFISAQNSTLIQKFTSAIPYYSSLHLRPLWFLSINLSIWLNSILMFGKENFILFRIENMIWFYFLIFLSSLLFFKITKKLYLTFIFLFMCLLYPGNINDICWTAGKVDLLCAVFLFISLLLTFSFIEKRYPYKIYLVGLFFSCALLTKETSVILPLITILLIYISYNREKVFEIKQILGMQIFILIVYFSYRIYIIGVQPDEVITKFQRPGIFNSTTVIFKAFISLIVPYDYISIQNYLNDFNLVFTLYSITILIFIVGIIFILIRSGGFEYIFLLLIIFLISISPNLIAGYFRPQLILIPFMFFTFALLLIADKIRINLKFCLINVLLVLLLWSKISFNLIQDWKLAYQKSLTNINSLIDANLDLSKRNIILGLPSRYRQATMLDYASGAYNYWKYGEFKMIDTIVDPVLTGALDAGSLNSEISIIKLSENEFELTTTGKTQNFIRLDAAGNKYKDKDITFRLSEKNMFKKPTILRLGITSDAADVYLISNDKLTKLNN